MSKFLKDIKYQIINYKKRIKIIKDMFLINIST